MRGTFEAGWLARSLAFLSLFLMYAALQELLTGNGPIGGRWGLALPALAASLCLGMAAVWLKSSAAAEGDRRRTELAESRFLDAIGALTEGEAAPFTLYLRPFKLTNQLTYQTSEANLTFRTVLVDDQKDIERYVAEAVEASAPLVGLGRPGEHHGAGRVVVSDELWRDAVAVLAHAAERIVLLPYPADGTLWEVEHVIDASLLDKVVFVMPPSAEHGVDVKHYWEACADIIKTRRGIDVPPWTPEGALFSIDATGRIRGREPLWLAAPGRLYEAVTRLAVPGGRALPAELMHRAARLADAFRSELERRSASRASQLPAIGATAYPVTTRDLSGRPGAVTVAALAAICVLANIEPALLPTHVYSTVRSPANDDEPLPEPAAT